MFVTLADHTIMPIRVDELPAFYAGQLLFATVVGLLSVLVLIFRVI